MQEVKGKYNTAKVFTDVIEKTLDEAPMAYKTMDDIVNNINPTAHIEKIIKPIFNFKAAE